MPGVNFDRAASFYDATRGLPAGVDDEVRDAILRHVGAEPGTRFLEVGVGTGRIALPFRRAGYDYVGVDLSGAMLGTLLAKLGASSVPRARGGLAIADAMDLPFRAGAFDVALTIHVLHLVEDQRRALFEARRVLRPGGRLIVSANEFAEGNRRDAAAGRAPTGRRLVANRWNAILADLGASRERRSCDRWIPDEAMSASLAQLGADVERVVLARYQQPPQTARETVAAHRDRIFSSDWDIPDDVHAEASRRLLQWLETEHPSPDSPTSDEAAFAVLIATLAA